MVGDRFVWIMHYGNDPMWMIKPTGDGSCSADLISRLANNHFVTKDVTFREDNAMTMSGLVSISWSMFFYRSSHGQGQTIMFCNVL